MTSSLATLTYFDDRGFIWRIDPWTLQISPIDLGQSPTIYRFYVSNNCTGPYYFWHQQLYPRVVFRFDGEPTIYRAFPDNPTFYSGANFHSILGGVGQACQPYGSVTNLLFVLGDDTVPANPIVVPTLPNAGPIHAEEPQ